MEICVVGGGNLGHTVAGTLAIAGQGVRLLTAHPEKWGEGLTIVDSVNGSQRGNLARVTSLVEEALSGVQLVVLCLPGYAIRTLLEAIAPVIASGIPVGSIVGNTGFFFEALRLLPDQPLWAFQRVPFISRIIEYGKFAEIKGRKPSLTLATAQVDGVQREHLRSTLEHLFETPTTLTGSYLDVSLSNSNPLLHTSRLYELFAQGGEYYASCPDFYGDWTERASSLLITMDSEFMALVRSLPIRAGAIVPILDYYESVDATSLMRKIRSISALQGIKAPMVRAAGGWEPDYTSRYFVEDFHYGLRLIVEMGAEQRVVMPLISEVYAWGDSVLSPTIFSRQRGSVHESWRKTAKGAQ